jgi:hypothetical protein
MKTNDVKKGGGLFQKIRTRFSNGEKQKMSTVPTDDEITASDNLRIIEEFEAIKKSPGVLSGWDFDRAFDFLEKYPDSDFSGKLKTEMYGTNSSTLKGLSYQSAVKILQQMPDHPGVPSILKGMRQLDKDFIRELRSDVLAYMLEVIPDHPLKEDLTRALAEKNLTNAYDFVERNPEHACTTLVIEAMFTRDPNIATLLLHERMDHPQVDAIFKGIYSIPQKAVAKLMPDAILFILDVASDHRYADQMMMALVDKNYIKAFDFVQMNPEHALAARMTELIAKRKPEIVSLLKRKREK